MKKIKYLMPVVFSLASVGATVPIVTSCGATERKETPVTSFKFDYKEVEKRFEPTQYIATITEFVGNETDIVIPTTISYLGNDYSVTTIAETAFAENKQIKSIYINPSNKNQIAIEGMAFNNCTSLVKFEDESREGGVWFSSTWKGAAFNNCTSLETIELSNYKMEWSLVNNCNNFKTIKVSGERYSSKINGKETNGIYDISSLEEKGPKLVFAFPDTIIPDSCKEMSACFLHCDRLTSFEVPASIETISSMTFYEAKNLTSIKLNKGLKTIGSTSFCYTGISELVIPDSVNEIGDYAFSSCPSLNKITIERKMNSWPVGWGSDIFSHASKTGTVYCHDGVEAIIKDNCPDLENWTFEKI